MTKLNWVKNKDVDTKNFVSVRFQDTLNPKEANNIKFEAEAEKFVDDHLFESMNELVPGDDPPSSKMSKI